MIHRVRKGESLFTIAKNYGVSPQTIAENNGLQNPHHLIPGEELFILPPTRTYTVRPGDTLSSIAERFQISKKALCRWNPGTTENGKVYPGQILVLSYPVSPFGALAVNGYVFPGCDDTHFLTALPRVQFMTFSCMETDGENISFFHHFDTYRKEAKANGILCLCRISFMEKADLCVGNILKSIDNYVAELVSVVKEAGFDGLTTAFFAMGAEDEAKRFWDMLGGRLKAEKLLFFNETDANRGAPILPQADASVLLYEKAKEEMPHSFTEGEEKMLREYEKTGKASKIFADISPFAFLDGIPVTKSQAIQTASENGAEIHHNDETKLSGFDTKDCHGVWESLENTKAKFELLDELGYMGLALDVMHTEMPIWMMAATDFAPVNYVFYSVREEI